MNYRDDILENKTFNFFKQLMYNIALAVCIMLVGVLIMVYGFKIGLYEVLSNSQAPYFVTGDMVVVKPQDEYKVGDILKFDNGAPVTHRLIGMKTQNGVTYYICHGDNVKSANRENGLKIVSWEEDAEYVQSLINENKTITAIGNTLQDVQIIESHQIEGKVIGHIDNYGTYFKFIKSHYMLLIAIVAGIWCFSTTIQNEIDMKKCRRLM